MSLALTTKEVQINQNESKYGLVSKRRRTTVCYKGFWEVYVPSINSFIFILFLSDFGCFYVKSTAHVQRT